MTFKVDDLEPLVREILSAPGVDMASITAKHVMKQLVELDDSISEDDLKAHKGEVKAFIATVFQSINEAKAASSKKREQESGSDEDGENSEDEPEVPKPAPKKKAKTSKGTQDADAELARKLSKEINGGRSTRQAATKPAPKKSTKRSKKKSAETVDSGDDEKPAKEKRPARGGFAKEMELSDPLATVLGTNCLPRTQVVKQLWVYIKANKLQNPENGKEILCDDKLRAVFSVNKIDMFEMNRALGGHLHNKATPES